MKPTFNFHFLSGKVRICAVNIAEEKVFKIKNKFTISDKHLFNSTVVSAPTLAEALVRYIVTLMTEGHLVLWTEQHQERGSKAGYR